jgi:hypothetical protein
MPIADQIATQSFQFTTSTASGNYTFTVKIRGTNSNEYYIENIVTPQGPYIENIPLPESVIVDMNAAITAVQGVNESTLSLDIDSFTFIDTESGSNAEPQTITVQNTGDFGSIANVSFTSNQGWVYVNPNSIGNIHKDQSSTAQITVDTGELSAELSPYSAIITVTDPQASNSPQTINVTFNILPKPIIQTSPNTTISFTTNVGISPPSQVINVSNSGPDTSILNFTVQKLNNSSWLTVTPTSGENISNIDNPIILTLIVEATELPQGTYADVIRISDPVSSNNPIDIEIYLYVQA